MLYGVVVVVVVAMVVVWWWGWGGVGSSFLQRLLHLPNCR